MAQVSSETTYLLRTGQSAMLTPPSVECDPASRKAQSSERELASELAPPELLLDWLALPHGLDFLSGLVLQLDGLVCGLLAQVGRLFFHSLESGLLGGLEGGRLRQVLFGERDGNNALAVLADLEGQRAEGNTHTFLADAQKPTDTDDNGADVAFAVEGEVIDIAQPTRPPCYGPPGR